MRSSLSRPNPLPPSHKCYQSIQLPEQCKLRIGMSRKSDTLDAPNHPVRLRMQLAAAATGPILRFGATRQITTRNILQIGRSRGL